MKCRDIRKMIELNTFVYNHGCIQGPFTSMYISHKVWVGVYVMVYFDVLVNVRKKQKKTNKSNCLGN